LGHELIPDLNESRRRSQVRMQAGASKSAMSKFGRLVPPPSGVVSKAAVKRALPQIADLYRRVVVPVAVARELFYRAPSMLCSSMRSSRRYCTSVRLRAAALKDAFDGHQSARPEVFVTAHFSLVIVAAFLLKSTLSQL
jgi:hypothetical protein